MLQHEKKLYSVDYGDNASVLFRIKYKGAQASGIVDIDSAGDITFSHGASGAEAVDSDTNLDAGGLGIIDLSADVTDYKSLVDRINTSTNWEAWLVGALPDADPHTTTTGHFTECTGADGGTGDCDVLYGYPVTTDDSDSKYINAGLTWMLDPTQQHFTDHQIFHGIKRIVALSTFASGTSAINVYACDDVAGTKELLATYKAGATTVEVDYPDQGYPIPDNAFLAQANGKRIVVQLLNSVAMGTVRLRIEGEMWPIGPAVREAALWSRRST